MSVLYWKGCAEKGPLEQPKVSALIPIQPRLVITAKYLGSNWPLGQVAVQNHVKRSPTQKLRTAMPESASISPSEVISTTRCTTFNRMDRLLFKFSAPSAHRIPGSARGWRGGRSRSGCTRRKHEIVGYAIA